MEGINMNAQLLLRKSIKTDFYELHAALDSIIGWMGEAEAVKKIKVADLFCYLHLSAIKGLINKRIEKLQTEGKISGSLKLSCCEILCLRQCLQQDGYNFYLSSFLSKIDYSWNTFNHYFEKLPETTVV